MYVIIGGVFDDDPENIPAVDFSLTGGAGFDPDGGVVADKPIAFTASQIVVRVDIKDGAAARAYYVRVTQREQGISANTLFDVPA